MTAAREFTFEVPERGKVGAILMKPRGAFAAYVFAHGAGAGMRHSFMEEMSALLGEAGVATLRYQFPYTQAGARRPDPPAVLERTVRAAVDVAALKLPGLPLVAGGKSMGGRMTSQAAAADLLPAVRGLVFFGFPLHAPGSKGTSRAAHLDRVTLPMLFLQGTRDSLAELELMQRVCSALGSRATLHAVEGGDHSFKVLKSSGRAQADVILEVRDTMAAWIRRLAA